MTNQELHPSVPARAAPQPQPEGGLDELGVPYAGQTQMRLTVTSGMADARLRIDRDATELIVIRCGEGTPPRLRASASELRVSWPVTFESWLRSLVTGEDRDIEVVLHPAVEWTLHVRGGLSHFEADLGAGKLACLEISGGASDARLDLPAPGGIVPIRISGGASNLALRRPAHTGVSLAVSGGLTELDLDEQTFDAIGGSSRLLSGPTQGDAPRYAVEIGGGASGLRVVTAAPPLGSRP